MKLFTPKPLVYTRLRQLILWHGVHVFLCLLYIGIFRAMQLDIPLYQTLFIYLIALYKVKAVFNLEQRWDSIEQGTPPPEAPMAKPVGKGLLLYLSIVIVVCITLLILYFDKLATISLRDITLWIFFLLTLISMTYLADAIRGGALVQGGEVAKSHLIQYLLMGIAIGILVLVELAKKLA